MESRKKSFLMVVMSLVFLVSIANFLLGGSAINASEKEVNSVSDSSFSPELVSLPETEEDLHNQEEVTVEEMEAYLDGENYVSPQAQSSGKITGSMTKSDYIAAYGSLNKQQNDAWNAKYNFRPETNVAYVTTYSTGNTSKPGFKEAFESNGISKIVLMNNISYTGSSTRINRNESIEIDGQGFLLEMKNSSINVDNVSKPENFTRKFSDVPVFHMHDIQIINNSSSGALEGSLANSWSFVNGAGEWGPGAGYGRQRGYWRYRVGNVYTPRGTEGTGTANTSGNARVGGRLIGGNRAEISMWGYNDIVTSAENFYTGGMTIEPSTYYKGMNSGYNYSVVWFIDNTGVAGDAGVTGTRKFDVGEGSFVYLRHRNSTYTHYPAVYSLFDEMRIRKNATYNSNMAGAALSFNVDNAKFIAEEGSTTNLLSRRSGNAPVQFGANYGINSGSTDNPANCTVEFLPGSKVFIVGNNKNSGNSGGVIAYDSTKGGHSFILNEPESFDIRNIYGSAGTDAAFLGDDSRNRGTNQFIIKKSDISIWSNSAAMDGAPTYDYLNVGTFSVTSAVANGRVTSSDSMLASQYVRNGFKRISGLNSAPELIWAPVTDADFAQKSTVLLGYVPVGGTDPFDENGDARTKPIYADHTRKAYVAYEDTLGNTYTGISGSDSYVHWSKGNHRLGGFQRAGGYMYGLPYRATSSGVPYRYGTEAITNVIDVTPPEPAKLVNNKVTNGTKQLIAENLEPNAIVYLSITGTTSNAGGMIPAGTVSADGKWSYNLTSYLNAGDTVLIQLEDNAGLAVGQANELPFDPSAPETNSNLGNSNPIFGDLTYRDATFKRAVTYTVEDIIPDKPLMNKTVVSSGNTGTQVGDTLTYTLTATNGKWVNGKQFTWLDVTITDVIPEELEFSIATAELMINDKAAVEGEYEYDENSRLLTVKVGNLNSFKSGKVTFKATVKSTAIGKVIKNTAKASGNSPREEAPFIQGPDDLSRPRELFEAEATVVNPGGAVFGSLVLASAPTVIDFKTHAVTMNDIRVEEPDLSEPLTVSDSRGSQKSWTLTAKLTSVLANTEDDTKILKNAIKFNNGTSEEALTDAETIIKTHKHASTGDYVVSDDWSNGGTGIKLVIPAGSVAMLGSYRAEITWVLGDTP